MSRQKEFDEGKVLDEALELFRSKGFRDTSFNDLTAKLGVSRQSLYDTYGDKQALYQAALQRYLHRGSDQIRRKLEDTAPIRKVLSDLFHGMIHAQCTGGNAGCMMVNSMVELSQNDPDTRAAAQAHARSLEGLFASRLSAAQRQGEISPQKDPIALARFFYHTVLGLAVGARTFGDKVGLEQTAQLALGVLD